MFFKCVADDIYKLDVPCGDGYTSVFAFNNGDAWMLADSGMSDVDVDSFIMPAVNKLKFVPEWMICSHLHDDHYGGFRRLSTIFPSSRVASYGRDEVPGVKAKYSLSDGEVFLNRYKAILLTGHTDESIGILDIKNNILIAFDCLQLYGIGDYGTNIKSLDDYIKTLEKVSAMNLEGIIASHDYELYGAAAFGRKTVDEYVSGCYNAIKLIIDTVYHTIDIEYLQKKPKEYIEKAAKKTAKVYHAENKNLPIVSDWTFQNVIMDLLSQSKGGKTWIPNK